MSLNVNPDIEDSYYRYKMPKLMTKIEGKGNGIKTVITNISDIAKAIYRKPSYAVKYFGMELGSQTIINASDERYVVSGNHDAAKLQEVLYTFIKKFVLCSKCGNPETFLSIKKKSGNVATKCKACGCNDILDIKHKITQYIFKNPPTNETEGAAVNTKTTAENENIDDVDNVEDVNSNIADADNIQELAEVESSLNELSINKTQTSLPSHEKTLQECNDEFFYFTKKLFIEGKLLDQRNEVRNLARKLKLKEGCIMIIMEIIFVSARTMLSDIEKYRSLLILFTREKNSNRDKFQTYAIAGMMKLVEKFKLASKSCYLLKSFYDHDIISEEIIIEWFEKGPSKRYVSKDLSTEILNACTPMIEWLRTAECESEDEMDQDNQLSEETEIPDQPIPASHHRFKLIQNEDDDVIDIDDL